MNTIEIIVAPDGKTRVETKGFVGNTCRDASRFIERALGHVEQEQLTAEFYAIASNAQQIQENQ